MTTPQLSEKDQKILEHLFNPDNGYPGANDGFTLEETNEKPAKVIEPGLLSQLQSLEKEGIKKAEEGNNGLAESVELFTKVIEMCPDYASGYNNRAQAYRMLNEIEKSVSDLDLAIEKGLLIQDKITLKQAYTQRGLHYKVLAKTEEEETAALKDIELGAKYGNELAKKIAVQENPYAKMCAAMVKEMLTNAKQ
ncbi:hypothetical protein K502DRAFT_311779 [Neoconidiobolus thromboides FSU 785]|nr:hypothetical protein K502DRAFT_311779 [Neoconidiobolus thromboides FSU 785]